MTTRGAAAPASLRRPRSPATPAFRPLLYTAQDVARFCEVDLKTIHHWADAGKIPHHRTEGRHLRFRRNHLVQFLRAHGYPLHDRLTSARPLVFLADIVRAKPDVDDAETNDDAAKKLGARFFVRRFDHAVAAIANLVAGEPDALVLSLEDPTWTGAATIAALKSRPDTSWPFVAVVTKDDDDGEVAARAGADLVLAANEIGRLGVHLATVLGVE
jgi:excisionase family DNA binding protein